jgi:hypothetical protein
MARSKYVEITFVAGLATAILSLCAASGSAVAIEQSARS